MTTSPAQLPTIAAPESAAPGETSRQRWWGRSSTALGVSLVLHAMVTAIAAVLSVGALATSGGSGSRMLGAEVALTSPGELQGVTESAEVPGTTSAPAVSGEQAADDLPAIPDMGGAGAGIDSPGVEGLGGVAEGLGGAGGDIGDGEGLGSGAGTGGGTSFFGVEAKGSRFLYICDISGSMNFDESGQESGMRLRMLQRELTESLNALLEHMSFYVLFFNSGVTPIDASPKWIVAGQGQKTRAVKTIGGLQAFGGTEPWPAFEMALAMRPPPDAIYFMTDGNFDPQVATRIQAANVGSKKIPIHCITLVDKSGEEVMRKIAGDSGGTYAHVPAGRTK